jgi:putative transposase
MRGRAAERARDLIRQTAEARGVVIVRGVVSPEHVHMLMSVPLMMSPAKLVQYVKGRSSRMCRRSFLN